MNRGPGGGGGMGGGVESLRPLPSPGQLKKPTNTAALTDLLQHIFNALLFPLVSV